MRILYLLALLALAMNTRAADGIRKTLELPPTADNPRNSEGSFVQLDDGRILFIYTHFTGGASDTAPAHLASRVSADGGLTWSDKDEIIPTPKGKQNVMSVSLLRLASGDIALFYLVKNSWTDCRPYMQVSKDQARTWSAPQLCVAEEGYYVVNNDRVVQLKGGRLIMPAAIHCTGGAKFVYRSTSACLLSDDGGKTWRRSETVLEAPAGSKSGLQEPGVVELKDGRLMMLCRTDQGCQMRSHSADGGQTWSPIEKTDIASPVSPMSMKRIPTTGDLLLVWNNTKGPKRTPLTVAVSKDEGKTWAKLRDIETDPDGWFCYTAIAFVKDKALLAYCAGEPKNRLGRTRITALDIDALYR